MSRVRRREMEALFSREEARAGGVWPLAPSYRIVGGIVYPVDHPDELPEPPAGGSGVVVPTPWVAPLAEPEAFSSFARLASHGKPSEEIILGWVRRYGLLRRRNPGNRMPVIMLKDESGQDYIGLNQEPVAVGAFRKEARRAYLLLRLYEMLRAGDRDAVRARLMRDSPDAHREPPGGHLVQEVRFGEVLLARMGNLDGGTDVRATFNREGLLNTCWLGLRARIEERIEGVKHTLSLPGGGFVVECPDVLTALYWQFACLVAGKRQAGRCEVCGELFIKSRKDKKVCGPSCRSAKSRSRTGG